MNMISIYQHTDHLTTLSILDEVIDLTPLAAENPRKFHVENEIPQSIVWLVELTPLGLVEKLIPISPPWIFIGIKRRKCTMLTPFPTELK